MLLLHSVLLQALPVLQRTVTHACRHPHSIWCRRHPGARLPADAATLTATGATWVPTHSPAAAHARPLPLAQVWEGEGVVKAARKIIGATNPLEAEPGTIRGDLAVQASFVAVGSYSC